MKLQAKSRLVSIPVYTMDQAKHLAGKPVPDGCTLVDIACTGEKGSIIWKKLPSGCFLVDYDAMQRRDAQVVNLHRS